MKKGIITFSIFIIMLGVGLATPRAHTEASWFNNFVNGLGFSISVGGSSGSNYGNQYCDPAVYYDCPGTGYNNNYGNNYGSNYGNQYCDPAIYYDCPANGYNNNYNNGWYNSQSSYYPVYTGGSYPNYNYNPYSGYSNYGSYGSQAPISAPCVRYCSR